MAVSKEELLSVLERYWIMLSALLLTVDDLDDSAMLIGTIVSTTEPTQENVAWVRPTDTES